jgi:hypothetical protein
VKTYMKRAVELTKAEIEEAILNYVGLGTPPSTSGAADKQAVTVSFQYDQPGCGLTGVVIEHSESQS